MIRRSKIWLLPAANP